MELPELKPWTSHMIFHWQPESLFEEDRRSNLWPLFWVILSAASLSSLIWLWIHLSKTVSILFAHAPLDLTDILNSYPNLPQPDSLVGLRFKNNFNLMTRNSLSLDWFQQFFISRCKWFSHITCLNSFAWEIIQVK